MWVNKAKPKQRQQLKGNSVWCKICCSEHWLCLAVEWRSKPTVETTLGLLREVEVGNLVRAPALCLVDGSSQSPRQVLIPKVASFLRAARFSKHMRSKGCCSSCCGANHKSQFGTWASAARHAARYVRRRVRCRDRSCLTMRRRRLPSPTTWKVVVRRPSTPPLTAVRAGLSGPYSKYASAELHSWQTEANPIVTAIWVAVRLLHFSPAERD